MLDLNRRLIRGLCATLAFVILALAFTIGLDGLLTLVSGGA